MVSKSTNVTLTGVVLDEKTEITLDDLCLACRAEKAAIVALVDEGIVEPGNRDAEPWRFSGTTLPQVARALRLQKDLGLNIAGLALALDLFSEIDDLRNRLYLIEANSGGLHD